MMTPVECSAPDIEDDVPQTFFVKRQKSRTIGKRSAIALDDERLYELELDELEKSNTSH